MAWMANDSAINVTPEIQKALENASIEEMKDILHSAAVDQKLAVPDAIDSSILHETGLAMNAPKKFTRPITVAADGGNKKTYTLEANSPEELQATEVQFWRELTAPPQGQTAERFGGQICCRRPRYRGAGGDLATAQGARSRVSAGGCWQGLPTVVGSCDGSFQTAPSRVPGLGRERAAFWRGHHQARA